MSEPFPTAREISTMLDQITEIVGILAANRRDYEACDRYETLWEELSGRFAVLNRAGIPILNPNPHRKLERFLGELSTYAESQRLREHRVGNSYSETRSQLQRLGESLHGADASAEVIRELRESTRRLNELFIVIAFRPETDSFRTLVDELAVEVDLVPNFAGAHETGEALSEEILSSIRRSTIVICDLSFERPNCYYEAGYAKGAFRHTIFTCREDHDPRKYPNAEFKVHFDVDQLKITWWDSERVESSRNELVARLRDIKQQVSSLTLDPNLSAAS